MPWMKEEDAILEWLLDNCEENELEGDDEEEQGREARFRTFLRNGRPLDRLITAVNDSDKKI